MSSFSSAPCFLTSSVHTYLHCSPLANMTTMLSDALQQYRAFSARVAPIPPKAIPLLDRAFIIPEVIYLNHQLEQSFEFDTQTPCHLPYTGIKKVQRLGKGGCGSVFIGELWSFDIITGWAIDCTADYGSKIAIKLGSSLEDPDVTCTDYEHSEFGLRLDAQGLMRCRSGAKIEPVSRTRGAEWIVEQELEEDELDFLVKLYFHRAIHPLSNIYKASNVHGAFRPHSVVGIELLPNGTLWDRIANTSRCMSEHEAWAIMRDLLMAIKRCHDAGVSHRDVKPQNICFNSDGQLTLIDFGLVEALNPAGSRCTRGTPSMMAPELIAFNECLDRGQPDYALPSMDARKLDIFAAGECLRWMIDTAWEPQGVIRAVPGDLERDGFVLAESLAFLNGLQERDPNLRWDVDQALEHCEKWCCAIAHYFNGPDPKLPAVSLLRNPRGPINLNPQPTPTAELVDAASTTLNLTYQNLSWDVKPAAGPTFAELQVRLRAAHEHFELEYTLRQEERSYGLVLREQERLRRLDALAELDRSTETRQRLEQEYALQREERSFGLALREQERLRRLAALAELDRSTETRQRLEQEYALQREERSLGLALREQERFTRLAALALREAAFSPPYPVSTYMPFPTITRSRPRPTQGAIKLLRLGLDYPRAVAAF